jgi:hypothetical protein
MILPMRFRSEASVKTYFVFCALMDVVTAARMSNVMIFFMICGCLRFDKFRKDSKIAFQMYRIRGLS